MKAIKHALITTAVALSCFRIMSRRLSQWSQTVPCLSSDNNPDNCRAMTGPSTDHICKISLPNVGKLQSFLMHRGNYLLAVGLAHSALSWHSKTLQEWAQLSGSVVPRKKFPISFWFIFRVGTWILGCFPSWGCPSSPRQPEASTTNIDSHHC